MASFNADGSIQTSDGRIIFADDPVTVGEFAELAKLLAPQKSSGGGWPFISGGGGNSSGISPGGSGAQGAQGSQGAQGPGIGAQGVQGSQGPQGLTGIQGAQGPGIGAQGVQGSQGSTGAQGVQGPTGAQGAAGTGAQGAQGSSGAQGSQGTTGAQGAQGSASLSVAMASWSGASGDIDCATGFTPKVVIVFQGNNFNAGNSGTSVGFAMGTGAAQQADMFEGQCDSSALATGGTTTGEVLRYLTPCVGTISVGTITQFDSTRVRLNLTGVCSGSMIVFG